MNKILLILYILLSILFIILICILCNRKEFYKKSIKKTHINLIDDKYLNCNTPHTPSNLLDQAKNTRYIDFKFSEKIPINEEIKLKSLLRDSIKVLEENKIPYFLSGGTLLGAYRQNDFIPWDDDADIMIRVEDHNKLWKLKRKFRKYGILLNQGCLSCWSNHYRDTCRYLKKKYNDLSLTKCKGSRYFSALKRDGMHIDIFKIFPIKNNGKIAYSLYGSNRLISEQQYKSMFPGIPCNFGGIIANCPNNTKELLCRNYKNINIPTRNGELTHKNEHVFGIRQNKGLHLNEQGLLTEL